MSNLNLNISLPGLVTPTEDQATEAPSERSWDGKVRDVIVVGSGPAGYTAAVYLARDGLEPLVLAGVLEAGGALMNTTEVENFPGFPEGIMGPELMTNMQQQAERFGADVRFEDVTELELTGDVKIVRTEDEEFRARTVVLATGSAYRELGVEGEQRLTGHGVSYCATCDGFFFKDKDIAVVGGGDSAMEEATYLTKFAKSVTVVHRRDELRASKIMAKRAMDNEKISFAWNSAVTELHGEDALEAVTLTDTVTGETRELKIQGLFVAIGHDPRNYLVKDQLELEDGGYISVSHPGTATSLPGVFACGDVVDHIYRQAITAAASGCRAAIDSERHLEALDG